MLVDGSFVAEFFLKSFVAPFRRRPKFFFRMLPPIPLVLAFLSLLIVESSNAAVVVADAVEEEIGGNDEIDNDPDDVAARCFLSAVLLDLDLDLRSDFDFDLILEFSEMMIPLSKCRDSSLLGRLPGGSEQSVVFC